MAVVHLFLSVMLLPVDRPARTVQVVLELSPFPPRQGTVRLHPAFFPPDPDLLPFQSEGLPRCQGSASDPAHDPVLLAVLPFVDAGVMGVAGKGGPGDEKGCEGCADGEGDEPFHVCTSLMKVDGCLIRVFSAGKVYSKKKIDFFPSSCKPFATGGL